MNKQWIVKPRSDEKLILELAGKLNIDNTLANLLIHRGITTFEGAELFFSPSLDMLHDPFLLKDMEKAVDRIFLAFENGERILIYGDYDVDGTTAVALVYSFLKKRYPRIHFYIPDRYGEGYGISYKGIDYASNNGYSLVIALDCGIKAVEKVKYAKSKNVDFIICDHHLPGDEVPQAVAVLDPKQPECNYPFKELSGCGVGFKLLQAFCIKNSISFEEIYSLIDLVAVSIAADIVPITGENRIFAYFGMKKLNENPVTGLKAIKEISGIETIDMNINDIVFKIGPRINAAGRIETGTRAVELLIAEEDDKALSLAKEINSSNEERKNLDQKTFTEALGLISSNQDLLGRKTTVLYNPLWHKGVIGIVASRLIEHYYRPTVILTQSNGLINGSARTVDGFDLYKAIESCGHLFENYGGHTFAAGVTFKPENLEKFTELFEQTVSETISEEMLIPHIIVDDIVDLSQVDGKFFRILQRFQPYGPGNMAPVFITRNVYDSGCGRTVGKNNEHLKLDIKHDSCPGTVFPAIGFNLGGKVTDVTEYKNFDICYSIDRNDFKNKKSLQLRLRDISINIPE